MEVEHDVDRSKDAKHQQHLQKERRETYRTKREAETRVEKQNRLESESNKRWAKRSTELPADVTSRKSNSRTPMHIKNTNRIAQTPTSQVGLLMNGAKNGANMDMNILVDFDSIVKYVAKYGNKVETPTKAFEDVNGKF